VRKGETGEWEKQRGRDCRTRSQTHARKDTEKRKRGRREMQTEPAETYSETTAATHLSGVDAVVREKKPTDRKDRKTQTSSATRLSVVDAVVQDETERQGDTPQRR
jgi:hypothetical protein